MKEEWEAQVVNYFLIYYTMTTEKKPVGVYLIEAEDFHCPYCEVLKTVCKDYLHRFLELAPDDRRDYINDYRITKVPTVIVIYVDGSESVMQNPEPHKILDILKSLK